MDKNILSTVENTDLVNWYFDLKNDKNKYKFDKSII